MNSKNFLLSLPLLALLVTCKEHHPMQEKTHHQYTNDLIHESSPYLLQHAHNPVEWHSWGEIAFEKAKAENKLILISVGYSACHWCHVMEHESFEDTLVDQIMNKHFINIKVDREERPDVDQVYMNAVQLMTGSGGWPLNCFALPDGRPVYGGTYFPKEKWVEVLESLQRLKETNPDKLEEYATNLTAGIQQSELITRNDQNPEIKIDFIKESVSEWSNYWDLKKGGPNRAPKFPIPNNYKFLLEYAHLTKDDKSLDFVKTTLDQMAMGGIYDQIGGGFARYSTDENWKAPHFEKMLYDNAQLVSLYAEAYTATRDNRYKMIVEETLEFVNRELTSPKGGFYSALDADSEGVEGKYYVWNKEELKELLNDDEFNLIEHYYNINQKGLWEHGNYILLKDKKSEKEASETEGFQNRLDIIKHKLLIEREKRVRPSLDDKILTSWNGLMIEGYVDAYLNIGNNEHLETAKTQMDFLLSNLQTDDGGLHHTFKNGKSNINGYIEDYAFTISALLKLYEATFDEKWLKESQGLADYCLDHFYDDLSGMFWFKSNKDEPLIAKKQENSDNVIPASNSVMAHNLFKLSKLFYNPHYEKVSYQMLQNILPHIDYGQSYSNWLRLALYHTHPFYEVAITGESAHSLNSEFHQKYVPNKLVLGALKKTTLPLLEGKILEVGTIFVCENKTCQLPVNSVEEAMKQITD